MNNDLVFVFRNNLRAFIREVALANSQINKCIVSETQCHALLEIEAGNELHLNELAHKLGLEKSTVSRTVDNLYKKKLIKRVIDKKNRRKINLSLTNKGREVAEHINVINNEYFRKVFGNINEDKQIEFISTLNQITKNMNLLNHKNE